MRELDIADAFEMIAERFPTVTEEEKQRLLHAALGFDMAYLKESFGLEGKLPETLIEAEHGLIAAVANVNGLTKDEQSEVGTLLFMTLQVPQRMHEIDARRAEAYAQAQATQDHEDEQGQGR